MPKQVDHRERREQIAEAVCRLAGRQGLDAVSLRHVADEAGVSMGRVQHYFTTKDELLLFAFDLISERVERRMAAAVTEADQGPRALLRALLGELLPISEPARAEAPVLVAFLARAVVQPSLVAAQREGNRQFRELIAGQIPTVRGKLDPKREADTLLALVDGLMTQLLVDHIDEEAAVATLDYHLDRIFG